MSKIGIVLGADPEGIGDYRLQKFAEEYHAGRLNWGVMTGKGESETLRDRAVNKYNVNKHHLSLEDKSKSTAGNYFWTRELVLPKLADIERLYPITQEWHAPRASALARSFLPPELIKLETELELLYGIVLSAPDLRVSEEIERDRARERWANRLDYYFKLPEATSERGVLFYENVVSECLERLYNLRR